MCDVLSDTRQLRDVLSDTRQLRDVLSDTRQLCDVLSDTRQLCDVLSDTRQLCDVLPAPFFPFAVSHARNHPPRRHEGTGRHGHGDAAGAPPSAAGSGRLATLADPTEHPGVAPPSTGSQARDPSPVGGAACPASCYDS